MGLGGDSEGSAVVLGGGLGPHGGLESDTAVPDLLRFGLSRGGYHDSVSVLVRSGPDS
jgi:hypothetical protein